MRPRDNWISIFMEVGGQKTHLEADGNDLTGREIVEAGGRGHDC